MIARGSPVCVHSRKCAPKKSVASRGLRAVTNLFPIRADATKKRLPATEPIVRDRRAEKERENESVAKGQETASQMKACPGCVALARRARKKQPRTQVA